MSLNRKEPRRALVTGATGFVGSHLARRLVDNGWCVHVLVRHPSNLASIRKFEDRVTVHRHDGSTEGMFDIVKAARPDIVFHLAAFSSVRYEPSDIVPMMQSNVIFGAQLAEAMIRHEAFRLINTGTYSQHFENKPYSPSCLYAATKQAFEDILTYYTEATPLQVITLKLFDNYGPDDPRPKILNLLHRSAKENKPLAMSPGEQYIDILYIDDIIDAYEVSAERFFSGRAEKSEVYAVSSGTPIKLKDLAKTYETVSGRKLPIQWGARPYREREAMILWDQGKPLPGWVAKTTLEEGIRKLIHS